ncbi:hypothetical protein GWK47_012426 [Chionoecetes opilio]|uniref:Uncharacterized protein n=1 Tax=Chionoecetes opilio TaxID=41210 RepID=A0A8J4Y5I6_CHIOP|nr:hypothetical protein GWK47_012426 [Chionoecetes opilio]
MRRKAVVYSTTNPEKGRGACGRRVWWYSGNLNPAATPGPIVHPGPNRYHRGFLQVNGFAVRSGCGSVPEKGPPEITSPKIRTSSDRIIRQYQCWAAAGHPGLRRVVDTTKEVRVSKKKKISGFYSNVDLKPSISIWGRGSTKKSAGLAVVQEL